MERVLDIYKHVLDPEYPVVCMDESPKQLISETKVPILATPGRPARHDYEYRRCGVCNIFLACEPLAGKRMIKITEKRKKDDWAYFIEDIAKNYKSAEKIILVIDNLNTHTPGSLYETFSPEKAKELLTRIYQVGVSLGGTISGEHGLGFAKKDYLHMVAGGGKMELMERIKKAFDPNGIMNPGKMIAHAAQES